MADGPRRLLLGFLEAEEQATARLIQFFSQARAEIEDYLRFGPTTGSEQAYYGNLLRAVNERLAPLISGSVEWMNGTLPAAYVEGALTHDPDFAFAAIHDQAVVRLSSYSVSLITDTALDIRRAIVSTIAIGQLEGLRGEELRQRIIATGLTPGRWRSVEERAGVIARTETMRAYNMGALDGVRSSGAYAVKWISSPDERVCSICRPRDGKTYQMTALSPEALNEAEAAWPNSGPLPAIPAHPRCRCTIRAQYRTDDGEIIGDETRSRAAAIVSQTRPIPADVLAEAQDTALRAQAVEPGISATLQGLTQGERMAYGDAMLGLPAPRWGDLAGFENRLKSSSSLARKMRDAIEKAALDGVTLTPAEAAESIGDVVRYTVRLPEREYWRGLQGYTERLLEQGYRPYKWDTWNGKASEPMGWGTPEYRGLNTTWRAPNGTRFELQFHTPESFRVKEINHHEYEVQRETKDAIEYARMSEIMKARTLGLRHPSGDPWGPGGFDFIVSK